MKGSSPLVALCSADPGTYTVCSSKVVRPAGVRFTNCRHLEGVGQNRPSRVSMAEMMERIQSGD
jgi:hypothetical protein